MMEGVLPSPANATPEKEIAATAIIADLVSMDSSVLLIEHENHSIRRYNTTHTDIIIDS